MINFDIARRKRNFFKEKLEIVKSLHFNVNHHIIMYSCLKLFNFNSVWWTYLVIRNVKLVFKWMILVGDKNNSCSVLDQLQHMWQMKEVVLCGLNKNRNEGMTSIGDDFMQVPGNL